MSPILEYFYGTKRFRSSYNSPKPRKLKLLPVQGTQKDSCNGNAEHLRRKSAPNLKWRTTICKSRKGNNESALKTTHSCLFRHRPIRPAPHLDDVSKNELLMYRLKFPAHARVVANSDPSPKTHRFRVAGDSLSMAPADYAEVGIGLPHLSSSQPHFSQFHPPQSL